MPNDNFNNAHVWNRGNSGKYVSIEKRRNHAKKEETADAQTDVNVEE
jgi:hypothetical protein